MPIFMPQTHKPRGKYLLLIHIIHNPQICGPILKKYFYMAAVILKTLKRDDLTKANTSNLHSRRMQTYRWTDCHHIFIYLKRFFISVQITKQYVM